jgi:hypothetical protein
MTFKEAKQNVTLKKYGDKAYHVFIENLHFGNVCGYKNYWMATWFLKGYVPDETDVPGIGYFLGGIGGKRKTRTRKEAVSEIIIETGPERR